MRIWREGGNNASHFLPGDECDSQTSFAKGNPIQLRSIWKSWIFEVDTSPEPEQQFEPKSGRLGLEVLFA